MSNKIKSSHEKANDIDISVAEGRALVIRSSKPDGTSYGGFKWPIEVGAVVTAPDWDPVDECGHGLHGLLYGWGDYDLTGGSSDLWWLVEVDRAACVDLVGKVKFQSCTVRAHGSMADMLSAIGRYQIRLLIAATRAGESVESDDGSSAAQIGSSGDSAQIGSSGDSARIGSSGYYAQIGVSGTDAVVACAGTVDQIMLGEGGGLLRSVLGWQAYAIRYWIRRRRLDGRSLLPREQLRPVRRGRLMTAALLRLVRQGQTEHDAHREAFKRVISADRVMSDSDKRWMRIALGIQWHRLMEQKA